MNYTIGTGYFNSGRPLTSGHPDPIPNFHNIWARQIAKATPAPKSIVAIGVGGCMPPYKRPIQSITLPGNLGYIGDIISGAKSHFMCGWSGAAAALAMIAYCNETDFIYVEQDCLCFGPWVEQLYAEIGSRQVLFGSVSTQAAAQSLFLVRHAYIPEFICDLIGTGPVGLHNVTEVQFAKAEESKPDKWGRFSFGYDRDRPFNPRDPVFYIQQVCQEDLERLNL